jgi:plasmid stabilization system protein ParE
MTFDFHEDALKEYEEAGHWYEERRFRLGVEFTETIDAAIAAILGDPERNRPAGRGVRVFRVKRFPYYVYYKFYPERGHVRIAAVAHFKRHPDYWRSRVL